MSTWTRVIRRHAALSILCVLLAVAAASYSGGRFLANLGAAIPSAPIGDTLVEMTPGDHLQQFYRYTLVYNNLRNGQRPYYGGYQFAFSGADRPFSEGPVFFPFSLICSLLAFATGPIVAFNLMVLASYFTVGIATFLCAAHVTKNPLAATVGAIFLACFPFRTTFLYSEMVYAVDLCFLPLIVYYFERYLERRRGRDAAGMGVSYLLLLTANMQLAYLFTLCFTPYFVHAAVRHLGTRTGVFAALKANRALVWAHLPCALYGGYVAFLLHSSGRTGTIRYADVALFSPTVRDTVTRFTGNETTIYLGYSVFLSVGALIFIRWSTVVSVLSERSRALMGMFGVLSVGVYALCFGSNLDAYVHVPVYRTLFEYVPGFGATRTPGRAVAVAGFAYAMFLSLVVAALMQRIQSARKTPLGWRATVVTVLLAGIMMWDFGYTSPALAGLRLKDPVYAALKGRSQTVLAVPFYGDPGHYLHASYLNYAAVYNLRVFSGYSSLFPPTWRDAAAALEGVNRGELGRPVWEHLRAIGVTHIVAHGTVNEPKMEDAALTRLLSNPNVRLILKDAHGHYLLELRAEYSDARSNTEREDVRPGG